LAESTIAKVDKREAGRRVAADQAVEGGSYASVAASSSTITQRPPLREDPDRTPADQTSHLDPPAQLAGKFLPVGAKPILHAGTTHSFAASPLRTTPASSKAMPKVQPDPKLKPGRHSRSDTGATERVPGRGHYFQSTEQDRAKPSAKNGKTLIATTKPFAPLTPRGNGKGKVSYTKSNTKHQLPLSSMAALQIVSSKAPSPP
jgi:hypothetical protein